jgi:Zn-finger nucleic acid-binding protein
MSEPTKLSGKLVPMSTSEGVTVDFDPETKGILFDPGEVALFFELKEDIPGLAKENARPTGRSWPCPKHPGGKLVEHRFPRLGDLELDVCDQGGCIWFDRGEIKRFEALTARIEAPRARLFRVFDRLRSTGYRVLGLAEPDEASRPPTAGAAPASGEDASPPAPEQEPAAKGGSTS